MLESNRVGNVVITPTKFIGIHVVREEFSSYPDEHWISDDNGGDKYFGHTCPTTEQVEAYRNEVSE